jgi:hypothetical protein
MSEDASRFRQRAEEAQKFADQSVSLVEKEKWLQMMQIWLKLAVAVEGRQGPPGSFHLDPRD